MASHFLSDCEAITIRLNEAPKGPVRKLFVSSWPDSNENRVHNLLPARRLARALPRARAGSRREARVDRC
jgi:hypothetical protein